MAAAAEEGMEEGAGARAATAGTTRSLAGVVEGMGPVPEDTETADMVEEVTVETRQGMEHPRLHMEEGLSSMELVRQLQLAMALRLPLTTRTNNNKVLFCLSRRSFRE